MRYASNDAYISVAHCVFACFDLVYAHSTPAYFSFDTPRNVNLVYNSRRRTRAASCMST